MTGDSVVEPGRGHVLGAGLFLDGDLHLRVSAFNSATGVTLAVSGQILTPEGCYERFVERFVPTTDRTVTSLVLAMRAGWLTQVQVVASAGTPRRGQCFVRVEVVIGRGTQAVSLGTVLQDYVQDTTAVAYPGSPIRSSIDGRGVLRSITGTNPAAGVEISEAVPTNARWIVHSVRALLVTDATVALRIPQLIIDDGATTCVQVADATGQGASETGGYHWGEFGTVNAPTQGAHVAPLPLGYPLQEGFRIRTSTIAIVAGDNYLAPQLLVEEWIED